VFHSAVGYLPCGSTLYELAISHLEIALLSQIHSRFGDEGMMAGDCGGERATQ